MKRRSFLKEAAIASSAAAVTFPLMGSVPSPTSEKGLYELKIYHVSRASNAKNNIEDYISNALIPYLKKHDVKVGVFNEYSLEEPAKLYCLSAFPDSATYYRAKEGMLTDPEYTVASKSFDELPFNGSPFSRYETFLMEAFDRLPSISISSEKKGLYELRLYESPTDMAGKVKMSMFNDAEIDLFLKVGLEPVFFGKIMAGQYMPALIYMVGFSDMEERDTVWARFNASEEWQKLRTNPIYPSGNVSNIRRIFLTPTDYSQI